MTTMNHPIYLQGRWRFNEDKANVKVIVRIWSLATNAACTSNSIVSMSTWRRGTYTCFISCNIDIQITTLLTLSLGLDTKLTLKLQYHSLNYTFADIYHFIIAVSWSGAPLQDLFLSLSLPTILKLSSLCCPLHCNRSLMAFSFRFCVPDLCFIISQQALTKIYIAYHQLYE